MGGAPRPAPDRAPSGRTRPHAARRVPPRPGLERAHAGRPTPWTRGRGAPSGLGVAPCLPAAASRAIARSTGGHGAPGHESPPVTGRTPKQPPHNPHRDPLLIRKGPDHPADRIAQASGPKRPVRSVKRLLGRTSPGAMARSTESCAARSPLGPAQDGYDPSCARAPMRKSPKGPSVKPFLRTRGRESCQQAALATLAC